MRVPLRAACELPLAEVALALGRDPAKLPPGRVSGVATDSRDVQPGDLFVARVGLQSDGHRYLEAARAAGAVAALVERLPAAAPSWPLLRVADTTAALGRLAHHHRRRLGLPLVAITGSNGKTTTKQMLAAILAVSAGGAERVLVSPGNFNNHVGVPLTLLAGRPDHRLGVVELGMNAPGEIDALAALVAPQVGLVTNASEAHLAGLGSVDGVARAKAELWGRLEPQGCAVVPLDDPRLPALARAFPGRRLGFGRSPAADVRVVSEAPSAQGGLRLGLEVAGAALALSLPLLGRHNALNAAAAAAAAHALGVAPEVIGQGLPATVLPAHRAQLRELGGVAVLDDCYNANPVSVRAALDTLGELPGAGRLAAVLGDLHELGDEAEALHHALGRELGPRGVSVVIGVGALAAALCAGAREAGVPEVAHVSDAQAAWEQARARLRPGDRVLVKGSRRVGLEALLQRWQEAAASPEGA
jgi:UDP-N-acetylmuramoyl-tripeptide--D-alanyl-D-alanine ligase